MTLQELGQSIREKREAAGLTLEDIAGRIKISVRILKSIEEGALTGLPHAVYTKHFIRAYGKLVGYDPEELAVALEQLFPVEALDEHMLESVLTKNAALSYPGIGRRIIAILVVLVFLGGLGGGTWYVVTNYGDQIIELVKKPFSAITSGEEAPSKEQGQSGRNSTSNSAVQNAFSALMLSSAPGEAAPVSQPPGRPVPNNAAPAVSFSPAPAGVDASASTQSSTAAEQQDSGVSVTFSPARNGTAAAQPGKNNVLLVATEPCWISARADGGRGHAHTLQMGESYMLSYADNLELTLGNAGGVRIEHNGKDLGAPGERGRRIVVRFPLTE